MFNLFGHVKAAEAKAEEVAKGVVADVEKEVAALRADVAKVAQVGAADLVALAERVAALEAKVAALVK